MKAIIMAGGSGTRLWPLSRSQYPKQFIALKDYDRTLFQMSLERCLAFCAPSDVYVLTVAEYEPIVRRQAAGLGPAAEGIHVLIEPQAKNTLPAIYNGVLAIRQAQGDDVAVVMTSDHLIRDVDGLCSAIKAGAPLAEQYIYAFGIKPTRPETGFGYVCPGQALAAGCRIAEFKEKPDHETAVGYVQKGYLWNSGMFMFHTELFAREVEALAPEVYVAFQLPDAAARFAASPAVSIDYGIMEKSAHTAVLPLDIDWDDLGSFATFYETYAARTDDGGNITFNDDVMIDAAGNLAYTSGGKACVFIGVEDLVVVEQPDALLICHKDRAQDVRRAVDALRQRGDGRADAPAQNKESHGE